MHCSIAKILVIAFFCALITKYVDCFQSGSLSPDRFLSVNRKYRSLKHTFLGAKADANLVNEEIQCPVVRLLVPKEDEVGEDEMIGVFPIEEALEEARARDLDLVLINEKADPPICKVIDYGKFKYLIEKRKKENLKKQIKVETKEIKMSPSIEQHDFDVRLRAAQKFLSDGDRVKVLVQFKGREMQHTTKGKELLLKLFQPLQETSIMDGEPKLEGRSMTMMLSPKKK